MADIKQIIDGKESTCVVPESFFMAKKINKTSRNGYSLKCVQENLIVNIYYKSGNFFDRKRHFVGKLCWDINTDIVTFYQYGSAQNNDCFGVWKDVVSVLRENDIIKICGKTKQCRKVYRMKVHNNMHNYIKDEKFMWLPKKELFKYLTKER